MVALFAPWNYEISFHQDNQRRPRIRGERVRRGENELVRRPNEEDAADPARLTQTCLEQVNVNQEFRDLAMFFGSIRYLHLVPQLVREPDRSVGRTNDPFGGEPGTVYGKHGKPFLKERIGGCNNASRHAPWVVLVDLDTDSDCAPPFRATWLPHPAPHMCFRVAWYNIALLREEVREGRSFNPDEFAIALEQVVGGTAPVDYRDPKAFFARNCSPARCASTRAWCCGVSLGKPRTRRR